MEVTKEFLEEHVRLLEAERVASMTRVHQLDGALAMAKMTLIRLEEKEEKEAENASG